MAKKNIDGLQIVESSKGVLISVKRFSSGLLLQQGAGIIILLAVLACCYRFSAPLFVMLVISAGIALLIYGMVYNLKDQYLMTMQDGSLEIMKGMHNSVIIDISLNEIQNVYIKNKEGRLYFIPKYGHLVKIPQVNELWIKDSNSKVRLVDAEMKYSVQVAIRDKIL